MNYLLYNKFNPTPSLSQYISNLSFHRLESSFKQDLIKEIFYLFISLNPRYSKLS